jgi:hypothetical protein
LLAPAFVAIALCTGANVVMFSSIEGISTLFRTATTRTQSTMLLAKNAALYEGSFLAALLEPIRPLASAISAEFVIAQPFRRVADRRFRNVFVRGLDPAGVPIHRATIDGGSPRVGAREVLIGIQHAGRFEEFSRGHQIWIGKHPWMVSGYLRAPGTLFESEIWCDRALLMKEFGVSRITTAFVQTKPDTAPSPRAADLAHTQPSLAAFEALPLAELPRPIFLYVRATFLLAGCLSFATLVAAACFLYVVATRAPTAPEPRGLLLVRGLLVAAAGLAAGLLVGWILREATSLYDGYSLVYRRIVSPRVLLAAVGLALGIGTLAGLISSASSRRAS